MLKNDKNLIWIDLEMTGLDPIKCHIIEIATLITDSELNILAKGPEFIIYQSDKNLSNMDKWNINTHTNNGLIYKIKNSKINENEAENITLDFLNNWVNYKKSPMCGNNVSQDRRFLVKYMPKLENYFNYKHLDVNSIKELVKRWKPEILCNFKKRNIHRAFSDIYESVEELIFYRKNFIYS
ncbi:oligoribonuclease [endosymbiont of Pachyrhynchus infernalis]|uniref:oligoribonuclease n=1 Tax=endosymbiont of Pachyrhynchus infernalis TaxID=1971488 RepID=UPI000DC71AE5|nr:oligoribonuclease [endosymbiont of Pachyrhynchus infernalis]BBA84937.1 oligoribonuclease [endosymbiont of Pachyrhynchus infernalis]